MLFEPGVKGEKSDRSLRAAFFLAEECSVAEEDELAQEGLSVQVLEAAEAALSSPVPSTRLRAATPNDFRNFEFTFE